MIRPVLVFVTNGIQEDLYLKTGLPFFLSILVFWRSCKVRQETIKLFCRVGTLIVKIACMIIYLKGFSILLFF